jgi:hypothetical protein
MHAIKQLQMLFSHLLYKHWKHYKSDVKFLGIQITENLRWNTHIKSICSNLNKAHFIIKTLKETTSYNIIRSIYHSYFQSRLKYGIIFWGAAKDSIKVLRIQKR